MVTQKLLEDAFSLAETKNVIPISIVVRRRGLQDYLAILTGYREGVAVIAFAGGPTPESAVAHLAHSRFRVDEKRD